MGLEIERKFVIDGSDLPFDLSAYPVRKIEQGYLNVRPAIRVRREDDHFYMTYKGSGIMSHEEYNLPLDKDSYGHLVSKADGLIIRKKRYLLPLNEDAFSDGFLAEHPQICVLKKEGGIKIELDVFEDEYEGRIVAEVEFPDEMSADDYKPAAWFGREVTDDPKYSNANMTKGVQENE